MSSQPGRYPSGCFTDGETVAQAGHPPPPVPGQGRARTETQHCLDLKPMFSLRQHGQGKRKVRPPNCLALRVQSTE